VPIPPVTDWGDITVVNATWNEFAYVSDLGNNEVASYQVDPITGALTSTGTVPTGNYPFAMAADPMSRFLYAANYSDNTISEYRINPSTGTLTLLGTVVAGTNPDWLSVEISGHFLYAVDDGDTAVWVYAINQTTGLLTNISTIFVNGSKQEGVTTWGFWY
jgi:6-phosphogluconolactonase